MGRRVGNPGNRRIAASAAPTPNHPVNRADDREHPGNPTVAVQNPDGTTAPVSGTYHCPVIRRGDNAQKAFLTITLSNGTGSVSFSLPEPGVYTIDPELIRPVPTAELPETLELLVTP